MKIGIGIAIDKQNQPGGGTSYVAPFGGNFTWWADINFANTSESGGIDYIDSVPLTGIADSLEQPTAASRPVYVAAGLDSNDLMRANAANLKIYKGIDASVFNGGDGTFAFLGLINNVGLNKTIFTEATATAYNFQISIDGGGTLNLYTDTDGAQNFGAFTYATYAVHHFVKSGTTLSYYKNGAFVQSRTVNQNMNTARPLTAFNYKSINAEQGQGDLGDIVTLTGTALNATEVGDDYTNFWKVKYPSLP